MNNPILVNIFKVSSLLFWGLVVVHLFQAPSETRSFILIAGAVLLVFHGLEALLFWTRFKQYSNNPVSDALQVVVFGIFHLKPFMEQAEKDKKQP